MTNQTAVSIVIPAYNEENAVADVLSELVRTMQDSGLTYEIILVDDGSQDATAQRAAEVEGVKIVRHKCNKGYGAALKTGIRKAAYDWICITDADGTYPNEQIPHLTNVAVDQDHDMVVGARTGSQVVIPLMRRPAKWAIRQLCSFVAGQKIPD
ncbi:MAG: glycosyltransferase family 2 protein, partial [Proteobacteria bacterium]|nr:glycosyltransferase family 2 protein [Pseudomonadota bacterium]MBU1452594.1 glycosyltransferase family 2 protein [Pseudomonadota bacterium]MBU2467905.1 glycosyltransferase family 2 protein [Pseudomonadota bacterium]